MSLKLIIHLSLIIPEIFFFTLSMLFTNNCTIAILSLYSTFLLIVYGGAYLPDYLYIRRANKEKRRIHEEEIATVNQVTNFIESYYK